MSLIKRVSIACVVKTHLALRFLFKSTSVNDTLLGESSWSSFWRLMPSFSDIFNASEDSIGHEARKEEWKNHTKRHQPRVRATIIYHSGSSPPTLPIKASMAQRWIPKKPGHPPIAHCRCPIATPVSFRGAHGVLRRTCYSLEASTGFLGHGAST